MEYKILRILILEEGGSKESPKLPLRKLRTALNPDVFLNIFTKYKNLILRVGSGDNLKSTDFLIIIFSQC